MGYRDNEGGLQYVGPSIAQPLNVLTIRMQRGMLNPKPKIIY